MPEFRLDRALTLTVNLIGRGRRAGIPILMYHGIRNEFGNRHPYFETNTSPAQFAAQMRHLHENGYRSIGLEDAIDVAGRAAQSERRVVVTFDDGYRDFYREAVPVLAKYGFTATVFVVSGFAQRAQHAASPDHMTWNEIREIARAGIAIGSHTVSHCDLRKLASSCLLYEVAESKRMIENEIGTAIDSFAYPFAFPEPDFHWHRSLRSHLRDCGYRLGVCTSIGTLQKGSDPFFLPRIPVNTHDDRRLFDAKLKGAYNWVRVPQFLYKYAAKRRSAPAPIRGESSHRTGDCFHAGDHHGSK